MTILDEIAAYARIRVEEKKKEKSIDALKFEAAMFMKKDFPFEKALRSKDISFICALSSIAQISNTADAPRHFASNII